MDQFDRAGLSPLMLAVQGHDVPMVELLLELEADPSNSAPVSGDSAFHLACRLGHLDLIELLLLHSSRGGIGGLATAPNKVNA